jgi:hypothetical protein
VYKIAAAAGTAVAAVPLIIILLVAASLPTPAQADGDAGLGGAPTALATQDIPANYLAWYMAAAQTCPGLPWSVLAGIGKVESDHGRSALPGVHSGASSAGAKGPMQLLPATFAQYAVNADPGQLLTPYDPADAIYTAARMLCADGARGGTQAGIQQAIFDYNHAPGRLLHLARRPGAQAEHSRADPPDPVSRPQDCLEARQGRQQCRQLGRRARRRRRRYRAADPRRSPPHPRRGREPAQRGPLVGRPGCGHPAVGGDWASLAVRGP